MKKALFFICLLFLQASSFGQTATQIRSNSEFLWAEGSNVRPSLADQLALEGLVRKLAATDILPVEPSQRLAVWQTYADDVKRATQNVGDQAGCILRYLAWRDIDKIFEPRWRKVRELVASAEKATNTDVARTYVHWATVYLSSLPPGETALRERLAVLHTKLGDGRTDAVRMRNVESEVAIILSALPPKQTQTRTAMKRASASSVTASPEPERRPFGARIATVHGQGSLTPLPLECEPIDSVRPNEVKQQRKPYFRWSALASADLCATPTIGAMVVGCGRQFGFYFSARSNYIPSGSAYDCRADGTTNFGTIWASGAVRKSRTSVSAGPVFRISSRWSLYAGAGYGRQRVLWEDTSSNWARVYDYSSEGLLFEAGALFAFRNFTLGLGLNETAFSSLALSLSAGWTF